MRFRLIFLLVAIAAPCCLAAQHAAVRQVIVHTHWGGLGPTRNDTITILRQPDSYSREGAPIDPALIDALVAALQADRLAKPEPANLGITPEWLKTEATRIDPQADSGSRHTTPSQRALFHQRFTDSAFIANILPSLFENMHTDDYPSARVEITFEDGTTLVAFSNSQFNFMLPWCVGPEKNASFNADISRAVAALLPEKAADKERLQNGRLSHDLTETIMSAIEPEWNLRGVEDRIPASLSALRQSYQVITADIDPFLHPEYGPKTYNSRAEQVNLHATLHKSSFPPNVTLELTLRDNGSRVAGVPQFLSSASRYESLALSVPWLNEFIRAHPTTPFRIAYVQNQSFGSDALRSFTADMKLRDRPDLIRQVQAQQSQIALLLIGQ